MLERRHDQLFLLADRAVGRDELRGIDEAAVGFQHRAGADEDVDVVALGEVGVQRDA